MRQKTTLRQRLFHEVKKTALATLYFLVGFNLLALMFTLLAPEDGEPAVLFGGATLAALIVGKVIMVSDGVFRRFAKGRGSFLRNVALKAVVFSLLVVVVLAVEELVHGVSADGLSWGEAFVQLRDNAAGGTRFLARFSYLMVLFSGYCFLFEIDRYFVGTSVGEIVTSKYRQPRNVTCTVMQLQLVERVPHDRPDRHAAAATELYEVFSRIAHEAGASLQAYRGQGGTVLWEQPVSRAVCQDLFDAMATYLDDHAEEHRARYGRALQLRGGAAQGTVLVLEVTSGDRREVIRSGEAIDRAEDIERAHVAPGLVFESGFPERTSA